MQRGQGFKGFLNYIRRNPAFGAGMMLSCCCCSFRRWPGFLSPKKGLPPLAVKPNNRPCGVSFLDRLCGPRSAPYSDLRYADDALSIGT
jgi:hypothetical protein